MDLIGAVVRDNARIDVGRVRALLLEPGTLEARWLEVVLHGDEVTAVVPASTASQVADGELLVPYSGEDLAAAGHAPGAPLSVEQAQRLRRHYGFSD